MNYFPRILHFVFGITLLGFAGLQINDPDGVVWIGFYAVAALIPLLHLFNKSYLPLFLICIFWGATELFLSGPGAYQYFLQMDQESLMQAMNPQKPYIEECREFLGVFVALVLVACSTLLGKGYWRNKLQAG